jgi:hypothetical protein
VETRLASVKEITSVQLSYRAKGWCKGPLYKRDERLGLKQKGRNVSAISFLFPKMLAKQKSGQWKFLEFAQGRVTQTDQCNLFFNPKKFVLLSVFIFLQKACLKAYSMSTRAGHTDSTNFSTPLLAWYNRGLYLSGAYCNSKNYNRKWWHSCMGGSSIVYCKTFYVIQYNFYFPVINHRNSWEHLKLITYHNFL